LLTAGKYVPIGNPDVAPIIAPLSILQERVLAAPALLANIITGKYCDALPLYRQEQPERSGDSQPLFPGIVGIFSKPGITSTSRVRPWPAGWL